MRVIAAPRKYIQGKGEIKNLGKYVSNLGSKAYAVMDPVVYELYSGLIAESFKGKDTEILLQKFKGECSKAEVDRLIEDLKQQKADVVIGIGGGKTLDTAKAVSYYTGLPVIIMPTAASSDAPCSALSVMYTDDGEFVEYLFLKANPDMVLVDSEVVANAPVRLTVAGIGDALATYYEARACYNAEASSIAGGLCSVTALSIAKTCCDTLFADGYRAKIACEQKTVTRAVENILESNIFLSGLGFESGGLAAAHAIHNGLTVLPDCHHILHGEKVAFGTITQLVLENAPDDELNAVISFCKKLGLPTTLEQLGIKDVTKEKLMAVAERSCAENDTMGNMPFTILPEDVYSAILVADKLGK